MVLLYGGVAIASFLNGDLPHNDFERFNDLRLTFLFFTLFVGLCAAYAAAYHHAQPVTGRLLAATTVAAAMLMLISYPVGSKDIFRYVFFGKIWGFYHRNPYVATPADFPSDAWQPFIQDRWRNLPPVYGPLFLWQSWLINVLSGGHLWLAVWFTKAWSALVFLASLWVARGLLVDSAGAVPRMPPRWLFLLLACNPMLLFESAGGGHNDVVMLLLLLGALSCWRARRPTTAMCLLAVSFWYKWYSVLWVAAFLIEALKESGRGVALRLAAVCAACAALVGAILLLPLPRSLPTVIDGLLHPVAMRGIYPTELSPPLAVVFWTLRVCHLFDTGAGFQIFDVARFGLFASVAGWSVVRQWRARPSLNALTESCFCVTAAFSFLLISMLFPWHLVTVITLGVMCARQPFVGIAAVLTVVAMLSYFLTFAVATALLGVLVGALWLVRRLRGPDVYAAPLAGAPQ